MNPRRHRPTSRDKAEKMAADLADKSAVAAAHAKAKATQLVQDVPDKVNAAREALQAAVPDSRPSRTEKRGRRHRIRTVALIAAAGAVAGYFLDPTNGRARRESARRFTNASASAAGAGFDTAAAAAHHTAEATAPEPTTAGVPGADS